MARQLTFELPARPALARADFFVSPANAVALAAVEDDAAWPGSKLVLVGPEGSGKTHLAHVWAAAVGASILRPPDLADLAPDRFEAARVAVEDADRVAGDAAAEAALLHLHNLVLASGGRLLLTAAQAPSRWPVDLADLASRLQATGIAVLHPPDDALLSAVLVKLFADRQLAVVPDVVDHLVRHMPRSLDAAGRIVAALDTAALREGRKIARPLVTKVLDRLASPDANLP